MGNIFVIDDDQGICETIQNAVAYMGHTAQYSVSLTGGLQRLSSDKFDLVLLDVHLPDGNGLSALPHIQKASTRPEVVIMTGYGDPDGAELAIKNGAWDYLQKPIALKELTLTVDRALAYHEEKQKRSEAPITLNRREIVGDSPALQGCLDLVAQAASGNAHVLITGETGTGKERFAWAIHRNSLRAAKNFVVVDCAALPTTLVESTLFGHEKGAFTGADRSKDGLIKHADGGTLFLDEIGELPLETQKSFLRVLQERTFRPVGSSIEQKSDFRLIAATNRNLEDMVKRGEFREDLLFRLRVMTIDLPPLRERREDIKPLALYHIAKLCDRYGAEMKGFSSDFFEVLTGYDWPGNIRELNHALETALASAGVAPMLFAQDLPADVRAKYARKAARNSDPPPFPQRDSAPTEMSTAPLPTLEEARDRAIDDALKKYLEELIKQTNGNLKEARRIAGLSRSRIYTLLKKYHVAE